MIPILIVGGTPEERGAKAEEITRNSQLAVNNFNTFTLESSASIGIDQIRTLQHRLSLKPLAGKGQKIALIQEAQNLTPEAQNALLKTLEEPPKQTQIILTVPNSESLLPTVVSRCQFARLKSKPQVSLSGEEFSQYFNTLISFLSSSFGERLQKLDELDLTRDRQKAIDWINSQIVIARQLLLNLLPQQSDNRNNVAMKQCSNLTIQQSLSLLKSLLITRTYLDTNVNIRLALDNLLIDLPKI
jgi:hypothetical protein